MNTMHENLRHPKVQPASDSSVELSNSVATVLLQIQRTSITNVETPPMIRLISLTHPGQANKQSVISYVGGELLSTHPVSGADLSINFARAPPMAPKANRTW